VLVLAAFVNGARAGTCSLPPNWESGGKLAGAVHAPAVTSCAGFVYVASGGSVPPPGGGDTPHLQRYDPAAQVWTMLAPVPVPVAGATLACDAAGGRLFLFGGVDISGAVLDLVQVYTLVTNTWDAPLSLRLPSPRVAMGSGVIGGSVYLAGGANNGFAAEAQNWEFSLAAGTYLTRAALPSPRHRPASGVSGGRLYIMGGQETGNGLAIPTNYEYDPIANSWTQKMDLPTAVSNAGGTALSRTSATDCDGDIIVVGGGAPPPLATSITQIYDVASNSWTPGPTLSTARYGLRAAQAGEALIVVGGSLDASTTVNTVDRIQPVPVGLLHFSVE
jgi:N-acetylneuraminic acid mutarotase